MSDLNIKRYADLPVIAKRQDTDTVLIVDEDGALKRTTDVGSGGGGGEAKPNVIYYRMEDYDNQIGWSTTFIPPTWTLDDYKYYLTSEDAINKTNGQSIGALLADPDRLGGLDVQIIELWFDERAETPHWVVRASWENNRMDYIMDEGNIELRYTNSYESPFTGPIVIAYNGLINSEKDNPQAPLLMTDADFTTFQSVRPDNPENQLDPGNGNEGE